MDPEDVASKTVIYDVQPYIGIVGRVIREAVGGEDENYRAFRERYGVPSGLGPFRVGDIVKLKTGESPQRVVGFQGNGTMLVTQYLSSGMPGYDYKQKPRPWTHYEFHPSHKQEKKEKKIMPKLYQTKEATPRYGTLLARDREGRLVLEMKGTPVEVLPFAADQLEEVRPWLVRVKSVPNGSLTVYEAVKGSVAVGDFLLLKSGGIATVTDVGVNVDKWSGVLKARRLVTEELAEADDSADVQEGD